MYSWKLRFVLAAAFLCALLLGSSYVSRNRIQQISVVDEGHSSSQKLGGDMAEFLWVHCAVELINMNRAIEGLEECKHGESNCAIKKFDSESTSEILRKATKYLQPSMKQSLLDCFTRISPSVLVSGDEGQSNNWYSKYLESLLPVSNIPRRYLASESSGISGAPGPSPTALPSASSPAPSPMVPDSPPTVSPAAPFFPPNTGSTVQITPSGGATPSSNSASGKSSHRSVAIAVGITVPVTLLVAALLLLCYFKFCKRGSAVRRNDKRPLLSLSLQELSDGPRQNPSIAPIPVGKDKVTSGRVSDRTSKVSSISSQASHMESGGSGKIKPSSEPHSTFSSVSATEQKPPAPPGMVSIAPPALLPPRHPTSGNVPPRPPSVGNGAPPPPPTTKPGNAISQPPGPPPPPVVKPTNAAPKPPGPPPPPPPVVKPTNAAPKPPGPPPPPVVRPSSAAPPPPPRPPAPPTGPRPPPPPKPPGGLAGSRPPPPPGSGPAPPRPPAFSASGPRPPQAPGHSIGGESSAPKPKLKPFFWDKVLANPDSSMVWNQIKSGSFQFDEEMIETLFGSAPADKNKNERKNEAPAKDPPVQYIKLIDSKKAQNISILLKALNLTTEEVTDALLEGYELPSELFQTLLKMAPTQEEELKLRTFDGQISQLGPAERFLKALVDIPFAFKRLECLLFITSLQEEVSATKQSFATLEVACKELRSSRLFLKLLEAVLKTGNRMNDGTFRGGAQAFKLDTLLKLSDVKGTDGKTTLLLFVVQEIIRSEGIRAARAARESKSLSSVKSDSDLEGLVDDSEDHLKSLGLEVVSHLSSELENVKKAAALDADSLTVSVSKLTNSLNKTRSFLNSDMKNMDPDSGFHQTLRNFVQNAEVDVSWLVEEEKRIMALVKSTGNYFHGSAGKDEGLHLFCIVRDFLIMVDKACKEVKNNLQSKPARTTRDISPSSAPSYVPDAPQQPPPVPNAVVDMRQRLFPAITDRRTETSSSDDEA